MLQIDTKEVKKLNDSSGYIPMSKNSIGETFIVITQRDLDYLLNREYKK